MKPICDDVHCKEERCADVQQCDESKPAQMVNGSGCTPKDGRHQIGDEVTHSTLSILS